MKLTDDQVQDMLKQLREHFNEPVMPLGRFCETMVKWIGCIEQGVTETDRDHQQGQHYAKHLRHVLTDIHKSALLGRMFFAGEEPRTEKCPEHKGHWSGLEGLNNECPHGCQLTGWLPDPR